MTLKARIICDSFSETVLKDVLYSATKVYNGLLYHLRQEYENTGKVDLRDSSLNRILKTLPRRRHLHSQTAQQIFREVKWAFRSFFALKKKGQTKAGAPGFRRKTRLSPVRYVQNGFKVYRHNRKTYLELSLGKNRPDGVRKIKLRLQHRPGVRFDKARVVNLQITYDTHNGCYEARLVLEVQPSEGRQGGVVAVDPGNVWTLAWVTEDGRTGLASGGLINSIRRYWQKVRSKVKPPSVQNPKMSRRYRQIARKESRQVNHMLHVLSKNFVRWCIENEIGRVIIEDMKGYREELNWGDRMNQRIHNWAVRKLVNYIRYKAELAGIEVEEVKVENTSNRCPSCGEIRRANRRSRGWYRCGCGFSGQADLVAAVNLLEAAQKVSPLKGSSGRLARPVVWRLHSHGVWSSTVHEPVSSLAAQSAGNPVS